jgi:hypothetical protein
MNRQQFGEEGMSRALRPKKARQMKSKVRSILIIFFGIKGIVHKEFILAGQTPIPPATVNAICVWVCARVCKKNYKISTSFM